MKTKMKDIGSIFPLYEDDLIIAQGVTTPIEEEGRIFYSLCREALYEIAGLYNNSCKIALLPAYTCMTVVLPFLNQGWKCIFYSINKKLRIDRKHLMAVYDEFHPEIVVAHPYYGMDFSESEVALLEELKQKGCIIVVDLTQCIFSKQRLPFVDYYVGSIRKWMAMPDGAFLETPSLDKCVPIPKDKDYNDVFVRKQTDSMYLRGVYFDYGNQEIKEVSRRINKEAVFLSRNNIQPHKMAALSYVKMKNERIDNIIKRRMSNFQRLYNELKENSHYTSVCNNLEDVTSAPLYFSIYAMERLEMQRKLAEEKIYAPLIWPLGMEEMLVSDDVRFIYQHILAIPCDQRYNEEDMMKIVDIINKI